MEAFVFSDQGRALAFIPLLEVGVSLVMPDLQLRLRKVGWCGRVTSDKEW